MKIPFLPFLNIFPTPVEAFQFLLTTFLWLLKQAFLAHISAIVLQRHGGLWSVLGLIEKAKDILILQTITDTIQADLI